MDNINNINNINNNINNINKSINSFSHLYDNQTYWDVYGVTVVMFIFLTLFVFFAYTYLQVMQKRQTIVDDWTNQRCNPKYLPFAGYITHPEGKTAFEYTNENFQYCVQNILVSITGEAVNPLLYVVNNLSAIFATFRVSLQQIRIVIFEIRNRIAKIVIDLYNRIFNILIPLQSVFLALKDTFNKIQGIMTTSLNTILGVYFTLKSLMGGILELTIKLLIALSIIIVGLWATPFTWPVAASATAIFLSISIPLAIIIAFMTDVLHIKSSAIPHLRRCFDKNTPIKMHNGSFKKIQDIAVGEMLENGIKVTAKFKVDATNLKMFRLNGVIVSETHIVRHNNKWVPISKHPLACEISHEYSEPFLYCLNTSNKEICINNTIFTDWDELYDEQLEKVISYIDNHYETTRQDIDKRARAMARANIHKYLDKGFEKDTVVYLTNNTQKPISEIKIGDKLSTKGTVYGVVEIETSDIDTISTNNINGLQLNLGTKKLYHLLVTNQIFETNGKIIRDYNDNVDFINYIKT